MTTEKATEPTTLAAPDSVEACKKILDWAGLIFGKGIPAKYVPQCIRDAHQVVRADEKLTEAQRAKAYQRTEARRRGLPDPRPSPETREDGTMNLWFEAHTQAVLEVLGVGVQRWMDGNKADVLSAISSGVIGPHDLRIPEALADGVRKAMLQYLSNEAIALVPGALRVVRQSDAGPDPQPKPEEKQT